MERHILTPENRNELKLDFNPVLCLQWPDNPEAPKISFNEWLKAGKKPETVTLVANDTLFYLEDSGLEPDHGDEFCYTLCSFTHISDELYAEIKRDKNAHDEAFESFGEKTYSPSQLGYISFSRQTTWKEFTERVSKAFADTVGHERAFAGMAVEDFNKSTNFWENKFGLPAKEMVQANAYRFSVQVDDNNYCLNLYEDSRNAYLNVHMALYEWERGMVSTLEDMGLTDVHFTPYAEPRRGNSVVWGTLSGKLECTVPLTGDLDTDELEVGVLDVDNLNLPQADIEAIKNAVYGVIYANGKSGCSSPFDDDITIWITDAEPVRNITKESEADRLGAKSADALIRKKIAFCKGFEQYKKVLLASGLDNEAANHVVLITMRDVNDRSKSNGFSA